MKAPSYFNAHVLRTADGAGFRDPQENLLELEAFQQMVRQTLREGFNELETAFFHERDCGLGDFFVVNGFLDAVPAGGFADIGGKFHVDEHNLFLTVKSVSADYHAPAKLDDLLEISSEVTDCGAATLAMRQLIRHEGKTLTTVLVTLVAISPAGKVLRLPAALREALGDGLPSRKKG